jgi:hypothetical protein
MPRMDSFGLGRSKMLKCQRYNIEIEFIFCFLSAPNFPQTKRGANGKFLPKPLLFHLRHPNSKTNEPKFWQILSPKNSFAKTSSTLKPASFSFQGETRPSPHHRHTENQKGNRAKQKRMDRWWGEGGTTQQKRRDSPLGCRGAEAVAWRASSRSVQFSFASPHARSVQDITDFGNRCELGTIQTPVVTCQD